MLEEAFRPFRRAAEAAPSLTIANLKALAHKAYIQEIKQNGKEVKISMFERAKVNPAGFPAILDKYKNNLKEIELEELRTSWYP